MTRFFVIEFDNECRSFPKIRADHQPGTVPGQDMFYDREAQTSAFFCPAGLHINTIEALGEARNVFF